MIKRLKSIFINSTYIFRLSSNEASKIISNKNNSSSKYYDNSINNEDYVYKHPALLGSNKVDKMLDSKEKGKIKYFNI